MSTDKKITELTSGTVVDLTNDKLVYVDVSDTTMDATGTTKEITPIVFSEQIGVVPSQTNGTSLIFDRFRVHGTNSAPVTGNIATDYSNAVLGTFVLVVHNDSVEPSYPATFKKSSLSGSYVSGSINYIACFYMDSTHVIYSISQTV